MSNSVYGGLNYPNSSFIFDKFYENYDEAITSVNTDGVLVGRYVLVAYCPEALSQDTRNQLESQVDGSPEAVYTNSYQINYKIDKYSSNVVNKKSYDRIVLRKKYLPNIGYIYEEIASLNSSLSDNSILFRAIQNQGSDQILSLSDLDEGGILSTTLNIRLANHDGSTWIQLIGVNDGIISEIDADDFIADGVLENVNYDSSNNTLVLVWKIWNSDNDSYITKSTTIYLDDIIQPYMAGNGITITNSTDAKNASIGIKINTIENENDFLTVDANGLKLTGVNTAISLAANDALETAINTTKNQITLVDDYIKLPNGVNTGDIGIIKTNIVNDKWSYTAYVWNGTAWEAMDGNYNADNVFLDYNLIITKDIGVQTLGNNSFKTLNTTGKSISQVLNMIMAKEEAPSITSSPKVTTSIGNGENSTPHASNTISVEGGSTIIPKWSASFNPGSYKYGPETEVLPTTWTIKGYVYPQNQTLHTRTIDTDVTTSCEGQFESILLKAGKAYKINVSADYTQGKIAHTNLGEEYKTGNDLYDNTVSAQVVQINAGSIQDDSPQIRAWQQGYYIGTLEEDIEITSNILRNIGDGAGILKNRMVKNNDYATQNDLAFSPSGTMKKFVVACPAGDSNGMASFFNNSSFEEYINNFTTSTIKVAGADNDLTSEHATDYTVYTWTPAAPFTGTVNFTIDFI